MFLSDLQYGSGLVCFLSIFVCSVFVSICLRFYLLFFLPYKTLNFFFFWVLIVPVSSCPAFWLDPLPVQRCLIYKLTFFLFSVFWSTLQLCFSTHFFSVFYLFCLLRFALFYSFMLIVYSTFQFCLNRNSICLLVFVFWLFFVSSVCYFYKHMSSVV